MLIVQMMVVIAVFAMPASGNFVCYYAPDAAGDDEAIYIIPFDETPANGRDNPPQFPGWPKTIDIYMLAPNDCPTLADLNDDGNLEILIGAAVGTSSGQVHIWTYDGNPLPGWPQETYYFCQSGPAVGDIDGDDDLEILAHIRYWTDGGRIYAWETDGTTISGFPINIGNWIAAESPSLRDMDNDGSLDLIAGFRDYPQTQLYIIEGDGSPWNGWPAVLDHVPSQTAATGDLDGDGQLEFVYSSYYSLYAFEADGTLMEGWPFTPGGNYRFNYSSAVLFDFDGDGDLEICCPSDVLNGQGRMYVFHHDGTVASGWPITLNHSFCYGSPSLGDVDNDGEIEIIIGDGHTIVSQHYTTLYCWNFDGTNAAGWPVSVPNCHQITATPLIADLDGDGYVEITASTNMYEASSGLGWYHGYNHDGTVMDGWPIRVEGFSGHNPGAVGDVDNDGDIDLCTVSWYTDSTMTVNLWDLEAPWNPDLAYWPMYQHDVWHTGELTVDTTGIGDNHGSELSPPSGFTLYQSYPNPTDGMATISFSLAEAANVNLCIYDVYGRKISTIVDETLPQGEYEHQVSGLSTGVYLYRLESGNLTTARRMVVK